MTKINIGKFINNLDSEDLASEKLQGVVNNVYAKAITDHKKTAKLVDDNLKEIEDETIEFIKSNHDRLKASKDKIAKDLNEGFKRKLKPGDKIVVRGTEVVIGNILDQYYDKEYIDIEFEDIKGNYRSWKSDIDGGKVIYKENLEEDVDNFAELKQEWEDFLSSGKNNVIEFDDGDYVYFDIDFDKNIMYAGSATNTGIFREYEVYLDSDLNLDENIAELYDHIVEEKEFEKVKEFGKRRLGVLKNGREVFIDTDFGSGYQVCTKDGFGNYNPWTEMGSGNALKVINFDSPEDAIKFAKEQYGDRLILDESKTTKKMNEDVVDETLNTNELINKIEKLSGVSLVYGDRQDIAIETTWRKNPRKVHADYLDVKVGIEKILGTDKFNLKVIRQQSRDGGKEFNYDLVLILPNKANESTKLKESLIEIPEEDIKYFEKLLDRKGFNIEKKGKTWFGNDHYQVISKVENLDEEDFETYVKQLQQIDDAMDERGIPMTFNCGLTEDGWVTAGIDLRKKYIKDTPNLDENLKEDTVKQGSQWVNKGKEGTHGKFKTKKEADAQRKAMFANGFKSESVELKEVVLDTGEMEKTAANKFDKNTTFEQWFDVTLGANEKYRKSKYYPFKKYIKTFSDAAVLKDETAEDILKNIHKFYDVYDIDSTDREYAFNFVSDVTGKDYEELYNAWIDGTPLTEAKSSKKFIYTIGDRFVAHQLDGVTSEFRREFDAAKRYRDISENPNFKHGSIGCKGKSYKAGVNQWVKDVKPTEFMVWTKKENPSYKDDVLDVYYRKENITESKDSVSSWKVSYDKGRPGGTKEIIKAKDYEEAKKLAAEKASGWGFEVKKIDECKKLKENWTVFEFTSGSNPYIAKTDKEVKRLLKKYKGRVEWDEYNGNYIVDDKENFGWDKPMVDPNPLPFDMKGYNNESLTEDRYNPKKIDEIALNDLVIALEYGRITKEEFLEEVDKLVTKNLQERNLTRRGRQNKSLNESQTQEIGGIVDRLNREYGVDIDAKMTEFINLPENSKMVWKDGYEIIPDDVVEKDYDIEYYPSSSDGPRIAIKKDNKWKWLRPSKLIDYSDILYTEEGWEKFEKWLNDQGIKKITESLTESVSQAWKVIEAVFDKYYPDNKTASAKVKMVCDAMKDDQDFVAAYKKFKAMGN